MTKGGPRQCYFLDATALAKVVADEPGSKPVRALHEPSASHALATTRLAAIEVASTLLRRARAGEVDLARARATVTSLLGIVEARYLIQDVTPPLARSAVELVAIHGLTTPAALTLAAVKELAHASRDLRIQLVSFDPALSAAARAERVPVEVFA